MIQKIKQLILKYKEPLLYLIFGGFTTLINLIVYWVMRHAFSASVAVSDVTAWVLSVIFAYVTNKLWVFESKSWKASVFIRELGEFFGARVFSEVVNLGWMLLTVNVLKWPDFLMKILGNVIVIIMNYVFSKFLIFKKDKGQESSAK